MRAPHLYGYLHLALVVLLSYLPAMAPCPAAVSGKTQYGTVDPTLSMAWRACLKGRKVLFMGNSVTRHWLFDVAFLLRGSEDNSSNSRAKEKKICGHGAVRGDGQGCQLRLHGATLNYTWMWDIHGDIMQRVLTRERVDYLVFNVGSNDVLDGTLRKGWYRRQKSKAPMLAELMANISLGGTDIYYRTSTHVCKHGWGKTKEQYNFLLRQSNHLIKYYLQLPLLTTLDTFKWTKNCFGYEDFVHHSKASIDHVLAWASFVCPRVREFVLANCTNATIFYKDADSTRESD